jgi:hypothetical protein
MLLGFYIAEKMILGVFKKNGSTPGLNVTKCFRLLKNQRIFFKLVRNYVKSLYIIKSKKNLIILFFLMSKTS